MTGMDPNRPQESLMDMVDNALVSIMARSQNTNGHQ
jgi:hypothetical protein